MKKYSVLLFCMLGLLLFNSCEDDRSNNPRYTDPTAFVLNTPKYAEGFYDLKKTETIQLTCSQPDYGYAAAAVYSVEISVDGNFDPEKGFVAEDQTLPTTSPLCIIDANAKDFDIAICRALKVQAPGDMPTSAIPVYVRLKSHLPGIESSVIYSNVITLTKVMPYYALPDLVLPPKMNMIGQFCGWNWTDAASMVPINGAPGSFWVIRYVKAGEGFKFCPDRSWDTKTDFGFKDLIIKNTAAGDVTDAEGNIVIAKGGWYIFAIHTAIKGRNFEHTLEILPPNVYVYGAANGGAWGNKPEWKFTIDEDPNAEYPFVSPTVLATAGDDGSCLRLCIHPDEWDGKFDWWKSEFIYFSNMIEYRGAGGDQARIGNPAGKVYLNFITGKAKCE
ncbi:MAG: SusF/SusE family outer membrane protein [Muribaculaceae bacterium]